MYLYLYKNSTYRLKIIDKWLQKLLQTIHSQNTRIKIFLNTSWKYKLMFILIFRNCVYYVVGIFGDKYIFRAILSRFKKLFKNCIIFLMFKLILKNLNSCWRSRSSIYNPCSYNRCLNYGHIIGVTKSKVKNWYYSNNLSQYYCNNFYAPSWGRVTYGRHWCWTIILIF